MKHPHDRMTDFEDEPKLIPCQHCSTRVLADEICEVPFSIQPKGAKFKVLVLCCSDCYDEVCDEEGYDPHE